MFSYRHGFHAGNHTDVLKHLVQVQLHSHMAAKEKPYQIVDTHAGAGAYSLTSAFAAKSGEYQSGIARLWEKTDLPAAVADYVAQVKKYNPDGALRHYPGSPQIALQMMREDDRLRLFELHSTEIGVLQNHFSGAGKRVTVQAMDSFAGLKSALPPPSRRGLALIDPSYEDKHDYRRVIDALRDALARFATGTYAVWYPQIQRRDAHELPNKLQRMAPGDWLNVTLKVAAPASDGFGIHGSGVFVFNPPWKLEAGLRTALPYLVKALGQDGSASHTLQFRQT